MRLKTIILLFVIVVAGDSAAADPLRHEFRGVWFSQNTVLELRPDSLDRLFKQFAEAGFNVVFPRVWYRGGTIYPSDVVEAAGGPRQLPVFQERDPMPVIIETAHRHGLEVHAWMEYGFMMSAGTVGPILTANPDWKIISKDSLTYEDTIYGRFYWADPANPEVRQFLVDLHREVAERYPNIDGIHTDRIRFPGDDFSYSAIARQRFQDETGGPDPYYIQRGTSEWDQWVQWRRLQTTLAQKEIYEAVKSVREDITVSAAVVPPYMIGAGAGQEKLQYWPDWTAQGYVDVLIPMLYLPDSAFPSQFSQARALAGDFKEVYPGITYQHGMAAGGNVQGANQSLAYQIEHSRSVNAEGYVLWYHGYLVQYDVLPFLAAELQPDAPAIPQRDRIASPDTDQLFQRSGTWNEQTGGPWGVYYLADPMHNSTASWSFRFPFANQYEFYVWVDGHDSYASSAQYDLKLNGSVTESISLSHQGSRQGWRYLTTQNLSQDDEVTVMLEAGDSDGLVFASAARARVRDNARIESVSMLDEQTLVVRFTFDVSQTDIPSAAEIAFEPSMSIAVVSRDQEIQNALVIQTSTPFSYYTTYTIHVSSIRDVYGRHIENLQKQFSYYPDGATEWIRILNDGDEEVFALDGNMQHWSQKISSVPGYIGNGYRQTFTKGGLIGLQRAHWTVVLPAGGEYKVSANWTSAADRAEGVPYIIHRNLNAVDTVRVDQRYNGGAWNELGIYSFGAGDTLTVELNNDVQPVPISTSRVIADAIQLKRMNVTTVEDNERYRLELPERMTLYQNYPNPFNPTTTIQFSLPERGEASLRVYDVLGRLVETIFDGSLGAGTHTFQFDGSRLSSGVYLYRLVSGEQMLTRSMLLLK